MKAEVPYMEVDFTSSIPQIAELVRKHFEKDKFITYPHGLGEYLNDGVYNQAAYKRAKYLWDKPDFPRIDKGGGVRGVELSDLKEFLKK